VLAELVPPAGLGAPSHPVWSPDGKTIAFGLRKAGNGLSYTSADVGIMDVSLTPTPSFANFRMTIAANAGYPVATNPTFTPDSKWLGFMRANKSRGSDGDSKGELWIAGVDGKNQVRLDKANGAGDLAATDQNWGPSFHPVAAGGYFWVAFYANRPWGHKYTGTKRQLWIAAVNANPAAGGDPSHPAFYIGGQERDSTNERPQFAVPPCKRTGESCESGYECCDGKFCRANGMGKLTCETPKENECAQASDICKVDADCCNSLRCTAGTCQVVGPN
jgi:WD40-like Beta Propeller Repeat